MKADVACGFWPSSVHNIPNDANTTLDKQAAQNLLFILRFDILIIIVMNIDDNGKTYTEI